MHAEPASPALGKLEALIAREKPELERQLALEVRRGGHPEHFAALLSDGQGRAPAKTTSLIPLALAQTLVRPLRALGWEDVAERFEKPGRDELLVLAFVEGLPGFGTIGVASVRAVGARA